MTTSAMWTIPLVSFVLFLGVQWWSSWYPGAELAAADMCAEDVSAKDEKNSLARRYGSTWQIMRCGRGHGL